MKEFGMALLVFGIIFFVMTFVIFRTFVKIDEEDKETINMLSGGVKLFLRAVSAVMAVTGAALWYMYM